MKYIKDELITHRRGTRLKKPMSKWMHKQFMTNSKWRKAMRQVNKLHSELIKSGEVDYSLLDKKTLFDLSEVVNLLNYTIDKAEANAPELIYDSGGA